MFINERKEEIAKLQEEASVLRGEIKECSSLLEEYNKSK